MLQRPLQFVFLIVPVFLCGCGVFTGPNRQNQPALAPLAVQYLQHSADAVQTLQKWYSPSTGLYQTTGWWNSANGITVLVDYSRVSGTTQYQSVFANTFTAAQKTNPGFLNKFYDDEGWWALAWIDAYDLTRDKKYLFMAESIFTDMSAAWDDTCGGGIWWSKDRTYKNAIANELFFSVAAHLANRTSGFARRQYLKWSSREWSWFEASSMIDAKNLINDGLNISEDPAKSCTNNGRTTWTYNQGVVLGGLVELSKAKRDQELKLAAQKIADAAIAQLTDENGILHDPCEPRCGADGVQFKGILIRNLVLLDGAVPRTAYETFVDRNADTLWKDARGPDFQLAEGWAGPFKSASAASQTSALDALVGAAFLNGRFKMQGP